MRRSLHDVAAATAVASVLSGGPSTVHAGMTGRGVFDAAKAAGTLVPGRRDRPGLVAGLVAHAGISVFWGVVLGATLPRRHTVAWGAPGDIPVPGDYFGLGRAQLAVYRPSTGEFFLRDDLGRATRIPIGERGDLPVPADYHGIGRPQIAVYRPGSGEWLLRADSGAVMRVQWGGAGDAPVPAAFAPHFASLSAAGGR